MPRSSKYVVKVQNRSGFDKSHRNSLTLKCGTLTPILCDELIPGSRVNLKLNLACQLAPLVSDTFMNVKLKAEAFFVPMRLLCASFEDFYCDSKDSNTMIHWTSGSDAVMPNPLVDGLQAMIPNYSIANIAYANLALKAGSLADYLGFTFDGAAAAVGNFNILPFVAYHLIWQEWYRNPKVQRPAFVPYMQDFMGTTSVPPICTLPYQYLHAGGITKNGVSVPANYVFVNPAGTYQRSGSTSPWDALADGVNLFALRQRNFGADYFTNGRVDTQQGDMSRVVAPDNVSGDAEFTIAALRVMNSLQQYKERNNIPSPRMVDVNLNRYGVKMSDGVAQRPICVGTASYDVYSRGVDQTAPGLGTGGYGDDNPNVFGTVGTIYGKAHAAGADFIIDDFEAKEPGYLMVLVSLVPEATYTAGIERMFRRYMVPGSITDMANPMLQNVGDQPIYSYEASGDYADWANASNRIFAYTDRYADWMFCKNRVHGQLRYGRTLQQFVLQRKFSSTPYLNTAFLEIPEDYLDGVSAALTNGDIPGADCDFSAWLDSMLQYRVSMPLAEYSVPSLQNPAYEHGKTVVLRRNGQVF